MCGIAGVIHRGDTAGIGGEMTAMLQAMKHRGPDSTGFALYGDHHDGARWFKRFGGQRKLAVLERTVP